ncbi:uncharacterized protein EAF01_008327 [Botrytis porri]|uniref:F-box domain-containing protein n=1 Tax=Botrytis porri TaxID=87229 RepID=A0A4Z1K7Y5_9HELO|nr:uncharacterized protein EAF01_008327 [Botrytis porri]KAF7899114.1 hypothetical protein EAF01_008327 [Botrytis porri]TGO81594.1 hypothetical protein BPOR_1090g00020 [Botrytis porri]
MANDLSQVLDGMKLEDGRPDIQLRMSAIQRLLNSSTLTFGEMRLFKAHFDRVTFYLDGIAQSPDEILTLVVEHLDLEDFMFMRRVSRDWREKLSNEKLCASLLKIHFRKTWEIKFKSLENNDRQLKVDDFLDMCIRRLKRDRGMYDEVMHYDYLSDPNDDSFYSKWCHEDCYRQRFQYKSGRIAMRKDPTTIQVIDLRTHVSRRYMHESRYNFDYWVLSDQMLVAYFDSPKPRFNVWQLDEEDDPRVVHLNCRYEILAAQNKKIAFGVKSPSSNYPVYIWNDGQIKQLAHPEFGNLYPNHEIKFCEIFFHPIQEDHHFLFYHASTLPLGGTPRETGSDLIIVQEYIAGVPQGQWNEVLRSCFEKTMLKFRLISDDGVVALLSRMYHSPKRRASIQRSPCNHNVSSATNSGAYFLMTFNLMTQKLGTISTHLEPFLEEFPTPINPLFWRGQATVPYDTRNTGTYDERWKPKGENKPYTLVSSSKCDTTKTNLQCVGKHKFPPHSGLSTLAAFCLPIDIEATTTSNEFKKGAVWGDDDFIIYSHHKGYIVWSFNQKATLPTGLEKSPSVSSAKGKSTQIISK